VCGGDCHEFGSRSARRRSSCGRKTISASSDCCTPATESTRREPIEDRKHRLSGLLRLQHEGIALNEHFEDDGAAVYRAACQLGCEGIVSKRLGSPYRAGRSTHWIKVKNPDAPAVTREAEEWSS
jgi:ATP-dependent DNA ligase